LALIGALAIAILVNVVQFRSADAAAPENYQAVIRKPSSDIVEVVSLNDSIRSYYGLYWAISEQQPGASVQISADGADDFPSLRFLALGYGKADSVVLSADVLGDSTSLAMLLADRDDISVQTGTSGGYVHRDENWYYVRGTCSDNSSPELVFGPLTEGFGQALVAVDRCLLTDGAFTE
jgi:hypothetical protein